MAKSKKSSEETVLLMRAVRRLLGTHTEMDKTLEALKEAKLEWSKQVRNAKKDFATALAESKLDGTETQAQRDAFDAIAAKNGEFARAKENAANWAAKRAKHEVDLGTLIEGAAPGKCAALISIATAYQAVSEAEAGRKQALQPLLADLEELSGRLKKQVHGAQQLGLFD